MYKKIWKCCLNIVIGVWFVCFYARHKSKEKNEEKDVETKSNIIHSAEWEAKGNWSISALVILLDICFFLNFHSIWCSQSSRQSRRPILYTFIFFLHFSALGILNCMHICLHSNTLSDIMEAFAATEWILLCNSCREC